MNSQEILEKFNSNETFAANLVKMVENEGSLYNGETKTWDETGLIEGMQFKSIISQRNEGSGDFDGYEQVFTLDGMFFKFEGYYSSEYGCDMRYDYLIPCNKITKTVVVYE